jgi:CheY-like chemotaxis protein
MSGVPQPYILLADDDPDDLFFFTTRLSLNHPDIHVETFEDGDLVLEFLSGKPLEELPRLVLLDYKMPRISGIEVLRTLSASQRFKHLPVVIWTTSERMIEAEECKKFGAAGYFVKPNSENELDPIIGSIIDILERSVSHPSGAK